MKRDHGVQPVRADTKRALVTGISGQDGSYLAELLLSKGYEVHGVVRRSSSLAAGRVAQPGESAGLWLHSADLTDDRSLLRVLDQVKPDEVYNLGAQSDVSASFREAAHTADVVATGALRLIDAVRDFSAAHGARIRFYQAGSSEMFGSAPSPQSETTPFRPRSPYGVSKVAAHMFAVNYRETYGLFICNGILFNHESPRRRETFVTRKITRAVGRIKLGLQEKLHLGNLEARRDWGFAGDYVRAMWLMLQQEQPDDYVIATGEARSVRTLAATAFASAGLEWSAHVETDRRLLRPSDIDASQGDAGKARERLGWRPSIDFDALIEMMVDHDIGLAHHERAMAEESLERAAAGA